VMSYFIEYGGEVYVFHGVSSDVDFNSFARLFESTMKSFNRLTDASKLNVKPRRVRVKRVQQNGTLADAFRYFGVQQSQMNELALLNNLDLSDRVQSGKLLKIIGE
jgi:predicted Zn-dependent protease